MLADFAFIQSQKGKIQLKTRDGFCYVKEKEVNDKIYWRCTAYTTKLRCHARIHTLEYDIVRQTSHNHLPIASRNVDKAVITEFVDIKPDHTHTVFKIWINIFSIYQWYSILNKAKTKLKLYHGVLVNSCVSLSLHCGIIYIEFRNVCLLVSSNTENVFLILF